MKLYPNISFIFIIWLLSILLIAFTGFSTLPHSGKFSNNFWGSLGNWDGGHYLQIAKNGYSQKFQYAFFPLFPLAVNVANNITGNYLAAAVLVSILSTFLGLQFLYRLVKEDFEKRIAEKAVLVFLFFPTSLFLIMAYSEGLFFFLAVATFYFLRKNKLFWATVFASLASATRLVGLAVVAGFLLEVWMRQGISRKNWYILLAPFGFVVYCLFLYRQTGDPFYFITAENHWQRALVTPGVGFWETLREISSKGILSTNFNVVIDLIFAIFGVGFAIRSFRFLPVSWAIYSLLSVGIPLFTPTLSSMPRFLLPVFPIFILIALLKNRYIQIFLQMISLMLLAVFTALFVSGYWVS